MAQSSWPPRWLTPVPEKAIELGRKYEPIVEFAEAFGVITKDSVAGKSGHLWCCATGNGLCLSTCLRLRAQAIDTLHN
jgi:hypothetical protein